MAVGNPITELSATGNFVPVTRTLTINGVSYDLSADRSWSIASPGGGSVTSVAMTVPTGFSVSGSPITSSGTLAVTFASGYALPTTVKQSNWDDAYTFVSNFPSQTGNNGKFLYTSGSVLSWQPALQNPMSAIGDMLYGGVSGAVTVLTGNQSAVRQYLQQVGTGSASTAPVWGGIVSTDISGQAITRVNDTNVTLTLTGTPGNSVLNAVGLTLGWSGTLTAARGGTGTGGVTGIMLGNSTAPVTGLTGIGGQILRANPSTGVYEFWTPTYLESPLTALGQIIYSGAGGQPIALNANSTANNMYLRSVSSGTPSWASIQGSDIVGAAITTANDTNITITASGNTTSALLRTLTLTAGWIGALSPARGGTGVTTITGVVIGNGLSTMSGVAGTAGQLLRRNAGDTAYEFFTPTYLSNPMTSLGDIIYGNASGAPVRLAANASASNQYLRSVSGGAPGWASIAGTDITGAAITTANDTNIQITASGNTTSALLRTLTLTAGWTGSLAVGRGGTGASTITGVLIGNGTSAVTGVTGTASQLLRRNAADTAYEFFTPNYLGNPMTTLGDIIYGNAAGAPVRLGANATANNMYLRSVSGGTPSWVSIQVGDVVGAISGSGTINYVPKWTPTGTALGNSQIQDNGTNVGIGFAGSYKLDVNGVIGLAGNAFAEKSGNYNVLYDGSGVASIYIGGTTANLNAYSNTLHSYQNRGGTVEFATISGDGLNVKIGRIQLPSTNYLTWGGAYGADIPTISGTSGTSGFLNFFPTGSSSGEKMRLLSTGQLRLNGYTSTSSFSGLTVGLLGFSSTGAITTIAIPGGVSGTQNYLAKFDSTGLAVGNSRFVDDGTNFLLNGASSYVTGFNLIGDIAIQSAPGQASSILLRSNQTPISGASIGIIDSYAITTGTTYTQGAGIEFRASQNWNSTSAGTNIFVQTAPDNTTAPADMFVFLNNGAVRFIGRTSNPIGAAAGTMYYNSSANQMRYYNGTTWISF